MSLSIAESLAAFVDGQAQWRERKSAEFPDDDRNARSAAALRDLAAYLRADPQRIHRDSLLALFVDPNDGTFIPGELVERAVNRHGFDAPVSPHAELVRVLEIESHRDELAMRSRGIAYEWWPLKSFRRVRDSAGRVSMREQAGIGHGVFLWRFPEDAVAELGGQRTRFVELEAPFEGVTYDGVDLSRALVTIEREGQTTRLPFSEVSFPTHWAIPAHVTRAIFEARTIGDEHAVQRAAGRTADQAWGGGWGDSPLTWRMDWAAATAVEADAIARRLREQRPDVHVERRFDTEGIRRIASGRRSIA